MGLIIELITVIILLICLWVGLNYIMLIISKYNADKNFNILFEHLKLQYETINNILSQFSLLPQDKQKLLDETKKYISQATNFSIETDGNERIIAFANAICKNIEILINVFEEYNTNNPNIDKYLGMQKEFNRIKDSYNKTAEKLKHYVDVFPSSLMARMKKITTMDYIN